MMREYNVYIIDIDTYESIYLYTTLAGDSVEVSYDIDEEFYKNATSISKAVFHVIATEIDDRSRDELIFDYIIEEDDSTSTADSK